MANVIIYTTEWCPYCTRAKKLLDNKKVKYTEINVSKPAVRAKMVALTGGTTVPQLLINDKATGGCDELYALERSGKLDKLLEK
ncbi:glutaredoxin 3 [Psychromonas ossibalaenae]|uniref:glutaredoxin 3 n=1 Tax=Psychromonas ossibalaenae TaxID=444922 RepID=UPI000375135F|nr:glutaredoxin 3 [Psychromonas ossibalaenae]